MKHPTPPQKLDILQCLLIEKVELEVNLDSVPYSAKKSVFELEKKDKKVELKVNLTEQQLTELT